MIVARALLVGIGTLVLCGTASAQINIYGSLKCDPLSMQRSVPAGDKPGHTMITAQQNCSWTQPLEIAGSKTAEGTNTVNLDRNGAASQDTGTHQGRLASGDQFSVRFSGSSVLDSKGQPRSQTGTWTFLSGTGALQGITGEGTYLGLPRAQGGMSYEIEGKYVLPKTP